MAAIERPLPPLAIPRPESSIETPFAGDLLEREALSKHLTGYLDRLKEGAVIAIDAPWGEGKTWFGRNWAKSLEEQHKVIYVDAFSQDYVEDPFLLLTAEIADAFKSDQGAAADLLKKATAVMQAILPVGTKALINIAGRFALGSADLSEEFEKASEAALKGAADSTSKWIEKKLKTHEDEKKSLLAFHEELVKFASLQEKPVVFFIDELDRCKPSFAVRLIERVKHFFDVPNLVFILLLNRQQLGRAVKGVYGAETDAVSYLSKFINFYFKLPKKTSITLIQNDHIKNYVKHIVGKYNFEGLGDYRRFQDNFSLLSSGYCLSLRDVERGVALYSFSQPPLASGLIDLLTYQIVLKISRKDLFTRLLQNETQAHTEAKIILDDLIKKSDKYGQGGDDYLLKLSEWHEAHISNFEVIGDRIKLTINNLYQFNVSRHEVFSWLAARIDLPIEV
jgi:hypothetical protein